MNEWNLVWLIPYKLTLVMLFTLCYAIGGRKWKAIRRFLGPTILFAGLFLLGFKWYYLFCPAILMLGLSLGYGADNNTMKLLKRLFCGFVIGSAGLLFGIFVGKFGMGLFQVTISLYASLYLGLFNPVDAVNEEALIAALSVIIIPFMI